MHGPFLWHAYIYIACPLWPDTVPGAGAVTVSRAAGFLLRSPTAVRGAAASLLPIHIDTEIKDLGAQAHRQVTRCGRAGKASKRDES